MKNLTWQNPEQLFVAQVLINQVKSKCCGIKGNVCRVLQLDANRYSKQIKDGNEIRKYNNRVTIVGLDLADVNMDDVFKC